MLSVWHDLRFGARTLLKNPGFTAVAVLSLGLGIGAITSVYSMISAVLLTPLPFEDADELFGVYVTIESKGITQDSTSYPEFREWKNQSTAWDSMAAYSSSTYNMTGNGEPERILAGVVTSEFFKVLRVEPVIGRNFGPAEEESGAAKTAIIAYKLWETRYGKRPDVLGQTLTLNSEPYTIIGVAPEDFIFLPMVHAAAYVPIMADNRLVSSWGNSWLDVLGRLKDGASRDEAQAEIDTISGRLESHYPEYMTGRGAVLMAGDEDVQEDVQTPFAILFGVVAFVLLIACVNVANLLLARAASRQKEIGIRIALGARRTRLIRQLLTESLLLALFGGALGLLFAMWGIDIIISLLPSEDAAAFVKFFDFGMNSDVFVFTLLVSLLTAGIFALVPSIQASNPNLNETLKEGGAGTGTSIRRHRFLNALVVVEVALALILLIGATLMVQSYDNLTTASPGFDKYNLLTLEVELTESGYPSKEAQIAFFRTFEERLAAIGAIKEVGATSVLPFEGSEWMTSVQFEGQPELPPGQHHSASYRSSTPNYLATLGAPILAGRALDWSDSPTSTRVAVVNDTFVKKYYPEGEALGKRFRMGGPKGAGEWIEIVGVVSSFKHRKMQEPPNPEFYMPYTQHTSMQLNFCVRGEGDSEALASSVRQILRELDPNQPLSRIETMESLIMSSVWMDRFTALLFAMFAGVALFLATIGVYGVINHSVIQRTREIGIRMALGAQPSVVRRWVVGKGIRLAALGMVFGIPGALGLGRVLQSLLYGISPTDPVSFVVTSLFLVGVAASASYLPARRATKVDPMIALRYE